MNHSQRRDTDVTQVQEWNDGRVNARQDDLVAEEPIEIRVNGQPLTVTPRRYLARTAPYSQSVKTLGGTMQWTKLWGGLCIKIVFLSPSAP